eukprot:SAG11_NODE_8_length_31217_cov_52.169677_17_plen_400_part_00
MCMVLFYSPEEFPTTHFLVLDAQLQAERAAKPYPQQDKMIFLQGLPFKSPADLRPFTSILFPVEKPGKRLDRGVLALGSKKDTSKVYVNNFSVKQKFRMDGLVQLALLLMKNDFILTGDLTEAYTTIHQNKRYNCLTQYQCFDRSGALITYRFKVLCCGHTQAPIAFTKFWKPILDYARLVVQIRCLILLDDIICLHQDSQTATKQFQYLMDLAIYLGFVVKAPKCRLSPSRQRVWAGALIDSAHMCLYLPRKKRRNVSRCAQLLLTALAKSQSITLRQFARALGVLRSCMMMVLVTRLRTQFLARKLASCLRGRSQSQIIWDAAIPPLIAPELEELRWWAQDLKSHNGRPMRKQLPDLITASDASDTGGGLIVMVRHTGWSDRPVRRMMVWRPRPGVQ